MKTITQTFVLLLFAFGVLLLPPSCKKDDSGEKDELQELIDGIIPQQYIDTLRGLGLTIYEGKNPPVVNGIYEFQPTVLLNSNRPTDVVGQTFANAKVLYQNQSNSTFKIDLLGKMLFGSNDTSINTAISGSGNFFTVYGQVKSTIGASTAIFAIIMSGELAAGGIKDFKYGIINVDGSGDIEGNFIKEGEGRIIHDSDQFSPKADFFKVALPQDTDQPLPPLLPITAVN